MPSEIIGGSMAKESTERDDEMIIDDERQKGSVDLADERVGLNVTYEARRRLNLAVAQLEVATAETWNQSKTILWLIECWRRNGYEH